MQQSNQNGDFNENARPATPSRRGRRAESGAAVVLVALLGVVAVGAVGCDGDDTTDFPQQGGSSGSGAGRSGAGGATAGASGSSGSSGASGAGVGGSGGGTGGAAGSSAGAAGTSAGTGGTTDDRDGGVDSGGPDADVVEPLTRQQMAEAICARYDELDGCEPSPTCVNDFVEQAFPYFESEAPSCPELIDAYFSCVAVSPLSGFSCQDGAPGINPETCSEEGNAMYASGADPACD